MDEWLSPGVRSPEVQSGVAVLPGGPGWCGPARIFLGKGVSWGGQAVTPPGGSYTEGGVCREHPEKRRGPPGRAHSARGGVVYAFSGLGSQFSPAEALEQTSVCSPSPRAPRHLCHRVQRTGGSVAEERTGERPSFLASRGRVPEAPGYIWACCQLSSCGGWVPGLLSVGLSLRPGPLGSTDSPCEPSRLTSSLPGPCLLTSLQSEAGATETPGWVEAGGASAGPPSLLESSLGVTQSGLSAACLGASACWGFPSSL